MSSDLLNFASRAADLALAKGCKESSATAYKSRHVHLAYRDGKVEKVTEATTRGLSLQLYVEGRYSSVSTSDLREEALAQFIGDAVAMAKTLAKDAHRSLPDAKLYAGRSSVDLGLVDGKYGDVTAEARQKLARQMEEAARSAKGSEAIVSVTASVDDTFSQSAKVATNGFRGEREDTQFWLSCETTCKDADGRRPEDWESVGSRAFSALPSAADVGRKSAERAIATLGAKKIESGVVKLVVENRATRKLLASIMGPLSGRALQQKQSFLDGQLWKNVGSKHFTVVDDPLRPGGFASRLYDGEGLTAKRMPVFESGVLKSYFIDVYYGRKLGMPPTTAGGSNLVFAPGKKGFGELLADVKEGVLLTSFLGGNSNATTGDFSFGFQGFRIRGGKRAEPVAEMNVAGNLKDLWKKLAAVGNDPYLYASAVIPTLVFDGVQIAGT